MSESKSHKATKNKAAGKSGKTEVPISGNRRLDATTKNKAIEVERSGNPKNLEKAAKRLQDSRKTQKVLQVPNQDIPAAIKAMKKVGTSGTLKNMSETRKRSVRKGN